MPTPNPFSQFLSAQRSDGVASLSQNPELISQRDSMLAENQPYQWKREPLSVGPLSIDLSTHWWTDTIAEQFANSYRDRAFDQARSQLLSGEVINLTEQRPAWHTALRAEPAIEDVKHVRQAMTRAHQRLLQSPPSGTPITNIVNLGVGGSDLGPCMVEKALRPLHPNAPKVHFISNVDGTPLAQLLPTLTPDSTVFIVCSKTFTTLETMTNFKSVRNWLEASGMDHETIGRHLFAATANVQAARDLAIEADSVFPLWDWVGGRYSVWSAIGLSLVLAFGPETFSEFLAGARAVDEHFAQANILENAPAIMAALDVWYNNYFNAQSLAVIAYESSLELMPNYLQQLMMESNGKSVTRDGKPVNWRTGQVIWGGVGTNTQHSFHQLLHQGTQLIPADFLVGLNPMLPMGDHHTHLVANGLAQTEALATGAHPSVDSDPLAAHKTIAGGKPFSLIHYSTLNAEVVGALIALYEHRVFCQALLWDIHPFDQWGVELGKAVSKQLTPVLEGKASMDQAPRRLHPFINAWFKETTR